MHTAFELLKQAVVEHRALDGYSEERLFVFRASEISNLKRPRAFGALRVRVLQLVHSYGGWHGYCKSRFSMRTAFNNLRRPCDSQLRAVPAHAAKLFQGL